MVDGQTVMLGGLIGEAGARERAGVPGVSRVPGIGYLFGRRRYANQRTELIILIKPSVIRGSEDAQHVADDLRSRLWGLGRRRRADAAFRGPALRLRRRSYGGACRGSGGGAFDGARSDCLVGLPRWKHGVPSPSRMCAACAFRTHGNLPAALCGLCGGCLGGLGRWAFHRSPPSHMRRCRASYAAASSLLAAILLPPAAARKDLAWAT